MMSKTFVLVFHGDPMESKANAALAAAARTLPDVEVVEMQRRYPDMRIDIYTDAAAEAAGLLDADRIVLQFPIRWYSTPALLKAWQDAVLTRMYYVPAATEGDRLVGTPLMVAATAGNVAAVYERDGQNFYTLGEILTPLEATAHRCGLPWHEPNIVYGADRLEPEALGAAAEDYRDALAAFIASTPADERAEKAARAMTSLDHDTFRDLDRGTPPPRPLVRPWPFRGPERAVPSGPPGSVRRDVLGAARRRRRPGRAARAPPGGEQPVRRANQGVRLVGRPHRPPLHDPSRPRSRWPRAAGVPSLQRRAFADLHARSRRQARAPLLGHEGKQGEDVEVRPIG
ncbi:NAD(P)H-dependent oxidoreductase [Salinarimonas ramus]|uniref:NAD(P)H-dependent oxidoreductase n=1 Tax=Salinarimonas ramus TaxID=690164 RepID=UPI001FCE9E03|nr:NAD(P)H-dependent oxidoreductase [Salinarimonas ramus]